MIMLAHKAARAKISGRVESILIMVPRIVLKEWVRRLSLRDVGRAIEVKPLINDSAERNVSTKPDGGALQFPRGAFAETYRRL